MSTQRDLTSDWRTSASYNQVSPFINNNNVLVSPKSTFIVNPAFERLSDDFLDTTNIGGRRGLYDNRGVITRSSQHPSSPKQPSTRSSQGRWFTKQDNDPYEEIIRLKRQFCVMVSVVGLVSIGSLLVTVLLIFGKITGRCCELQGM